MKSFKMPMWVKPSFWGGVAGALIWWSALSSGLGWMSQDAAKQMAAQQTQEAVVAYATPACVARFEKQPNAIDAWKALEKTDEWTRSDAIKKGGWITEPGQKLDSDIQDAIANSCASQLLALTELNGTPLVATKK